MVVSSDMGGGLVGVVGDDVGIGAEVAFEAHSILLNGLVALAVVSNELHELELLLVSGFESGNRTDSGDSES